ncbi:hypothetical protein [Cellulomonas sp. NS3]|uniref:hypothetical protein n=1 Tax=Cellulomonas sp. NS3 TaxID=2973977 RepID=UPI002161939B|nr:hypothetical protein [Cellulomonas sp. NS3]
MYTSSANVGPSWGHRVFNASVRGGALARQARAVVEVLTGAAALGGGSLMIVRPDGSLIGLQLDLLHRTPFTDWRLPGVLLAGLVGTAFVVAGLLERAAHQRAALVSLVAGAGLVVFELVEWWWIGFHPLQAVFLATGSVLGASAVRALVRGVAVGVHLASVHGVGGPR